jgi:DNA-directed RNA polymerase sigma subunit (sigma70/sigma32)
MPRRTKHDAVWLERRRVAHYMRQQGMTLEAIGKVLGISGERVRGLLIEYEWAIKAVPHTGN